MMVAAEGHITAAATPSVMPAIPPQLQEVPEAKDPRACSQLPHELRPPQWEMYTSAKHGVITGHRGT